jgi:hypothetical protein
MENQRDMGDLLSMVRSGFSGREFGVSEGEEGGSERPFHGVSSERPFHGTSITMVFILRSAAFADAETSAHHPSRTLVLVSSRGASSSVDAVDAEATATDNEEADDIAMSMEAPAGSQEDAGEDDNDPSQ